MGCPPVIRRVKRQRRVLSSVVALTLRGKIYKRHFHGSIHAAQVVVALQQVRRLMGAGFILIWDRLAAHRSKPVRDYLAAHPEIRVEWLPPYAPDINPEEFCHGTVKQHLRNMTCDTVEAMQQHVDRQFARLRHRRDMILGFLPSRATNGKQTLVKSNNRVANQSMLGAVAKQCR